MLGVLDQVVSNPKVQRQIRRHLPVVLDVRAVVFLAHDRRGAAANIARCGIGHA